MQAGTLRCLNGKSLLFRFPDKAAVGFPEPVPIAPGEIQRALRGILRKQRLPLRLRPRSGGAQVAGRRELTDAEKLRGFFQIQRAGETEGGGKAILLAERKAHGDAPSGKMVFTPSTPSPAEAGGVAEPQPAASDNAAELLEELNIEYNKLRQQSITTELLDILGGQVER